MNANTLKLFEAAHAVLQCSYCPAKLEAEDLPDIAEWADKLGWTVNKVGKVKCYRCTNKMKKTKT